MPTAGGSVKNEFPAREVNLGWAPNLRRLGEDYFAANELVGRVGFEPTTNGLKGRCSTTELPTRGPRNVKDASPCRKQICPQILLVSPLAQS
jgi:hypothetical protein